MKMFREPVNGFIHFGAGILSIAGLVWLVTLTYDNPTFLTTVLVYGISMILLYAASATLHLVRGPKKLIDWLNRLDHAAIYLFIAGTYTPICYRYLSGNWQWGMLATVWVLAATGVVIKLTLGVHRRFTFLSTLLYLGMGWLMVFALPQLFGELALNVLWLLVAGGVTYSVGAIFFLLDKPEWRVKMPHFGMHEIWHLCVVVASSLHFSAMVLIFW